MASLALVATFLLVALASRQVGEYVRRARLPLITGYLVTGALVGPFVLGWISQKATHDLRVVDNLSLAFIAFAAGNELYIDEIKSRLRSIVWSTVGLVIVTFSLGSGAVLLLADHVPFLRAAPFTTRLGVALMAGAILVARSPSSAIAIVSELRARGPFTKTALGVTIVMDAVVILTFAVSQSFALALVHGHAFDPSLALLMLLDLLLSFVTGYVTGRVLAAVLSAEVHSTVKSVVVLAVGLGVYYASHAMREATQGHLSRELTLEPLLACMVAGFWVTNFSRMRNELKQLLESVGPLIYLVFFTLVGASLALDALSKLWPITLALFGMRLVAIMIGSAGGGAMAGNPSRHNRIAWMAYITQAGVALGLAKDVIDHFPTFGAEFATLMTSVIVLSQVVGPPFLKLAIKRVGEAHLPGLAKPDAVRDAVLLGIDNQSVALARELAAHKWQVVMADVDAEHVEQLAAEDIDERHLADISAETLSTLMNSATDACVTMFDDDELNLRACEIARERFGIPRVIVQLRDLSNAERFAGLGALVVEPSSAMVKLLDQFVRAPDAAALLLHRDPEHEIAQVTIADLDIVDRPLRDLWLPLDVQVLEIRRDGHVILPRGFTIMRLGDEVTLVGNPKHIEEVSLRWGY